MPFTTVVVDGGLDLVSPPQSVTPGRLLACMNYEIARLRGIRRMDGYEKYDGGQSPSFSSAAFIQIQGIATGNKVSQYAAGKSFSLASLTDSGGNTVASNIFFIVVQSSTFYDSGLNQTDVNVFCYAKSAVPFNAVAGFGGGMTNGSISITQNASIGSVSTYLSAGSTVFTQVSGLIQQVPGQGSVNGLFWLKNRLYAVRDYITVAFSNGAIQPNPGDQLFQGGTGLSTCTWTGYVAGVVLTSGSFGAGTASGSIALYNTGTYNGANVQTANDTFPANGTVCYRLPATGGSNTNIATLGAQATAFSAGLYAATGGRGIGITAKSWFWCDLGWNLSYKNCSTDFVDMNFAVTTQAQTASQAVVTPWRNASGGSSGGWTPSGGAWPAVVADAFAVDSAFAYWQFNNGTQNVIYQGDGTGILHTDAVTLTNFGFTDHDIPPAASVVGIEIQVIGGTSWNPSSTGTLAQTTFSDYQVKLLGPATWPSNGPILSGNTYASFQSTGALSSFASYGVTTVGYGTPTAGATPSSTLGYPWVTQSDVTSTSFGLTLQMQYKSAGTSGSLSPLQAAGFLLDKVQMRIAYLPVTNSLYFWNPTSSAIRTTSDGAWTINTSTLTSATAAFTAADVGKTISIQSGSNKLTGVIGTINSGTSVVIVQSATTGAKTVINTVTTFSAATLTIYDFAVRAQAVMHYQQGGLTSSQNASGVLYFQFIQNNGTVGGNPIRPITINDQIRSWPVTGLPPDGGFLDSSTQFSGISVAPAINVMDCTAQMQGVTQPDNSTAPVSKYQSITSNFYAQANLEAIYGLSGGGPAFFFDGIKNSTKLNYTVPGNFCRILTGVPLQYDTPRAICAHQGHLVLSYYAGTALWSNALNVLSFDDTKYDKTASQNAFSDVITCIASINGDALLVGCRKATYTLNGNLESPTTLYENTISPTTGMREYSLQPMTQFTYCDFRGVTTISTTNAYGDFVLGHLSDRINPWIIPRLQTSFFESTNTGLLNSYLSRNKNQYRACMADGWQVTMAYVAQNEPPQFSFQYITKSDGVTPLTLDVVQAFTETTGRDRIFAASNDLTGNVYEMDRGNTFNGLAFPAFVILVPDTAQMAYQNKMFSSFVIFGEAQDYATFSLSRSKDYTAPTQATGLNVITETFGSSAATATGNTNPFFSIGTAGVNLEGTAINFRFDSNGFDPTNTFGPQSPHVIQVVCYDIEPLQEVQQ